MQSSGSHPSAVGGGGAFHEGLSRATVTPPVPPGGAADSRPSLQFFDGFQPTNPASAGVPAPAVFPPQGRIGSVYGDANVSAALGQKQPPLSGPFMTPMQFIGGSSQHSAAASPSEEEDEFCDEPPLLEELGVHPEHILQRMKSVLFFYRLDHDLLVDSDMCGPLFVAMCLGFCLLLSGKIHFGYIYGLGIVGCLGSYLLLNLMTPQDTLDLYRTMSILGYGLIPVVLLAFISVFLPLRTTYGSLLCILCILWCTATASRFFETALKMHHQKYLVAYPIGLLYTCFVLITVF